MLVTISRLVSSHESNWLSTSSSFRKRLWCLALLLLGCAISQPLLAQQNDRSVLVREDLKVVAASNAQVELAAEPQSSSLNAFYNTPPVSTNPFIPPRPPASMLADSDQLAKFRSSTRGTYTVSPSPDSDEQLPNSKAVHVLLLGAGLFLLSSLKLSSSQLMPMEKGSGRRKSRWNPRLCFFDRRGSFD